MLGIVRMMLEAGAGHVVALEPSAAMAGLRENTRARAWQVTYLQTSISEYPMIE